MAAKGSDGIRIEDRKEEIALYVTSSQLKLVSEDELASFERQGGFTLAKQYRDFMKTFGIGTYGGAICIQSPDFELLEDFSDCDFWQHQHAPITQEQIEECGVIGNSIDGDFIAIHPNINGYLLLPRDSETITLTPYSDEDFVDTVRKIGYELYQENLEHYFEPVGNEHIFLRAVNKDLHDVAKRFQSAFQPDYLIENEYMCEVFLSRMGGYVRFNFSYDSETAVFYSGYGTAYLQEVIAFLHENGCN